MDARFVAACTAITTVVITVIIATSLATLHTTEIGLKCNHIWQTVSPEIYYGGLHFVGLGGYFVKFKKTVLSTEFSTHAHDVLHARTSDGLPIILGVSFQYAYVPEKIYDLYLSYLGDHDRVYFNTATHLITEESTRHTAYAFFDEPQTIAQTMQEMLDDYFKQNLYARVVALQINTRVLPDTFNDAILESLTTKQNITNTVRFVDRMNVTLETRLLVARQDALATIAAAEGTAQAAVLKSQAAANITSATFAADVQGYSNVKDKLTLANNHLLKYVYWDSIAGRGVPTSASENTPEYAKQSGAGLAEADVLVDLEPSILARTGG